VRKKLRSTAQLLAHLAAGLAALMLPRIAPLKYYDLLRNFLRSMAMSHAKRFVILWRFKCEVDMAAINHKQTFACDCYRPGADIQPKAIQRPKQVVHGPDQRANQGLEMP